MPTAYTTHIVAATAYRCLPALSPTPSPGGCPSHWIGLFAPEINWAWFHVSSWPTELVFLGRWISDECGLRVHACYTGIQCNSDMFICLLRVNNASLGFALSSFLYNDFINRQRLPNSREWGLHPEKVELLKCWRLVDSPWLLGTKIQIFPTLASCCSRCWQCQWVEF